MLLIPYVCAEFRDRSGNPVYRITPEMRGCLTEAPEAIKQDLLFDMLVADGSIKVPESESQKRVLEADPMAGVNAEGRSAVMNTEKPAKSAKTEPKAEEKTATAEK